MNEIQKNPDINWEKIEKTIDEAIERDESYIVFKFKEIEEYRYIQKVVGVRSSDLGLNFNLIVLVGSVGISFTAGVLSAFFSIRDISIRDLKFIVGFLVFGFIFVFIATWASWKCNQQFKTCNKIILNAEKRLLWMERESKKSHSNNNHAPELNIESRESQ